MDEPGEYYVCWETPKARIRSPYKYAETAAAVRKEIEKYTNTSANLLVVKAHVE